MYTLSELSSDQLHELCQQYLCATRDDVSWSDLAHAESLVTMDELEAEYGDTLISHDDFICTPDMAVRDRRGPPRDLSSFSACLHSVPLSASRG